jgi:hypothetical protein
MQRGKKSILGRGKYPLGNKGIMFNVWPRITKGISRARSQEGRWLHFGMEHGEDSTGLAFLNASKNPDGLKILYTHLFIFTVWLVLEITAYWKMYAAKLSNNLSSHLWVVEGFKDRIIGCQGPNIDMDVLESSAFLVSEHVACFVMESPADGHRPSLTLDKGYRAHV